MTNNQEPQGRLELAVQELRASSANAGPSEELMQKTLARVGRREMENSAKKRGWWIMVRRTAVAAALAVIVGAGALLAPWGGWKGTAFADVIEQIKQVHSVKCMMTSEVELADHSEQESTAIMVMADPGISITEIAGTFGMKLIADEKNHKMMILSPESKLATVVDIKRNAEVAVKAPPNVLEYFKRMTPAGSTALGEKEIDGVKARGFRSQTEGSVAEVWADVTTDKPVLVILKLQDGVLLSGSYTFTDFEWNPKVDADDLAMKVPDGYRINNTQMDLSKLSEEDVVKMLQTLAEANEGVLPESVDQAGATATLTKWALKDAMAAIKDQQPKDAKDAAITSRMMETMMEKMAPVARGWGFMVDVSKGVDWTYGGSGVKVTEKGKAALWYKPTGGQKWRVIDADGQVHEEAAEPVGGKRFNVVAAPAGSPPMMGPQTEVAPGRP